MPYIPAPSFTVLGSSVSMTGVGSSEHVSLLLAEHWEERGAHTLKDKGSRLGKSAILKPFLAETNLSQLMKYLKCLYFEVRNDYEAIMTMALPERQLEPVASPSWSLLFSHFFL